MAFLLLSMVSINAKFTSAEMFPYKPFSGSGQIPVFWGFGRLDYVAGSEAEVTKDSICDWIQRG